MRPKILFGFQVISNYLEETMNTCTRPEGGGVWPRLFYWGHSKRILNCILKSVNTKNSFLILNYFLTTKLLSIQCSTMPKH